MGKEVYPMDDRSKPEGPLRAECLLELRKIGQPVIFREDPQPDTPKTSARGVPLPLMATNDAIKVF